MTVLNDMYPADFVRDIRPEVSDAWQYLHGILVDTDDHEEWSDKHRKGLARLLDLAERHGELTQDAIRRLRSPDPEQFWGRLNEFKAAYFFESRGLPATFRPTGRGTREGEFLLHLPACEAFVEVKTMFRQFADRQANRHLQQLRRAARRIPLPAFISLWILEDAKNDFRIAPFAEFLEERLPILMQSTKKFPAAAYHDERTGLKVEVTFMSKHRGNHVLTGAVIDRLASDHVIIRGSLKRAYDQLPAGCPSVVVLCSQLGHPPSPVSFHDALYGKFGVVYHRTANGPVQGVRAPDGFLVPGKHTRLSAVLFFDEFKAERTPGSHIDIYHHPTPVFPFSPDDLLVISHRQWLADDIEVNGAPGIRIQPLFDDDDD